MPLRALVVNPQDNVANLIGSGTKGAVAECTVEGQTESQAIELLDDVPANHKIAFCDITAGDTIVKYGLSIGRASCDIAKGQYVHVHNIESNRGRGDLSGQA